MNWKNAFLGLKEFLVLVLFCLAILIVAALCNRYFGSTWGPFVSLGVWASLAFIYGGLQSEPKTVE